MTALSSRLFILVMAGVVLGCLALGTWQLQRLSGKQDLLARIAERMAAPPEFLPAISQNWRALDFRRYRASGQFLHGQELILGPRSYRHEPGYHVLTPFVLDDGRILLVNRGWVPLNARDPGRRPQGQSGARLTLSGVLRSAFKRGFWTPDYDAKARLWYWYDVAGMARVTGLKLLPAVLQADAGGVPGGLPIGGVTKTAIANNHLQYAILWYALAAVIAAMFAIFRWRAGNTKGS